MWLVEGTTYNCNVNRPSCRDALIEEKEDMKEVVTNFKKIFLPHAGTNVENGAICSCIGHF
jgi:hypothetical protein